jgi:hypothetical protein
VRETPTKDNMASYVRVVRQRAIERRMLEAAANLDVGRVRKELADLEKLLAPPSLAIVLRHAGDIVDERREAVWLDGLYEVLERSVLAVLAGPRNTFKSFIALHWAMQASIKGEPVVILSAEGAGLGRRIEAWLRYYAPAVSARDLPILALERAVNLNAAAVMQDLHTAITAANRRPSLFLVDTLSKYAPGLKENVTEEMTAFLSALGEGLRDHYGATVLLVAHSGHADPKRPRGSSTLMCNPDAEYIVERASPSDTAVTVSRERYKDSAALTPLAYLAEVVDLQRVDRYGKSVTSLVLKNADASAVVPIRKAPQLRGKAHRQLLAALRAAASDGTAIWTLADMREVGRKAGLDKGTARSAVEALTFTPYLIATVGGYRLNDSTG